MDRVKTGKFIAELRKENNMTQKELADRLNVTDRAVGNWENGRRLPDYSIITELCSRLNISVNELFAGERIRNEEKEEQFEKNLFGIITISMNEKKKHQFTVGLMSVLLVISMFLIGRYALIRKGVIMDPDLKYVRRYDKSQLYFKFEQLESVSLDYEMGVNKYANIVFRYPDKALERLKADCPEGIEALRKAFDLPPLSNWSYGLYGVYGWQLITENPGASDIELQQGRFISKFMDIYENSFYPHRY